MIAGSLCLNHSCDVTLLKVLIRFKESTVSLLSAGCIHLPRVTGVSMSVANLRC